MKKLLFTLLSTIVIISMIFTVTAITAFAAEATADSPKFALGATPDSPGMDTERIEARERIKNMSPDDFNFADNIIIVTLYKGENPDNYKLETFEEYGIINIERLYNINFLILTLDSNDKQNVLDVCYALYDIPGIRFAEPSYYQYPDDVTEDAERIEAREYIKNNVTVDHEFVDNEVTVLLYEDENPYDYTLETFEKYGVINVKRSEYNEYHLLLTLDRHDKQNVLDVCYALYDIPGIRFAEPNYIARLDDLIITPTTEPTTSQPTTNIATPDTPQNSNGKTDNSTIATGNPFESMYLAGLAAVSLLFLIIFKYKKRV